MITIISGDNVPQAYIEALWQMRFAGKEENSRNGKVITLQDPAIIEIKYPRQRVLFDPVRDANPFFHVMEFVWMMAGSQDVAWIKQFNKRMGEFSDDGTSLPASYGYRWRKHFGFDQIEQVIAYLKEDPTTRRAVLSMWDPHFDLGSGNPNMGRDKPCNTEVYFRCVGGVLNMTVHSRSNDLIWGALGANAVHMTFLHELVAFGADLVLGTYRVVTNNLHMYTEREDYKKLAGTAVPVDEYRMGSAASFTLLRGEETVEDFLVDCERFVENTDNDFITVWMNFVALPLYRTWVSRAVADSYHIAAPDWRLACLQWLERRAK